MKNKKLLSVLVSAVLLCACIAGVLMMGTSAEVVTTTYQVGKDQTYATIKDALHAAAKETWAANSALVIEFTGQDTSAIVRNAEEGESTNLFFGQTTIFNAEGEKLPITIRGVDSDLYVNEVYFATNSANANVKHFAFANDYTFENLYFSAAKGTPGEGRTYIYAGSGNVVFQNVAFKPEDMNWTDQNFSDRAMNFNGDNFTMDAFYGWELEEGEKVETSITFGENVSYFPGAFNMSDKINAIGYEAGFNPDLSEYETSAEAIAAAKELAADVEFQAGELTDECAVKPVDTIASIIVDTGATASDDQDMCTVRARRAANAYAGYGSSPAEAVVEIRSGNLYSLATSGNVNNTFSYVGDITITISGGAVGFANENYCINMPRGEQLYGDLTLNVSGSANLPKLWQTVGNATQFVLHGTYTFNMDGGVVGTANNETPAVLGTQNYGLMGRQGTITNITGGEIKGNYYSVYLNQGNGGTLPAALVPATYAEYIDGSVDIYNFVGKDANVETFVGGYYDIVNDVVKNVGNIVNVIDGDGVTNFIAGNYTGHSVDGARNDQGFGNVTNIITGGTFAKQFFGNNGNDSKASTKTIKNVVLGGTFKGNFYGGAPDDTNRAVINIIKGGSFQGFCYLGGKDGNSKAITSTISGGNFANHIYGGPEGGIVNGDISTTFTGTPTGLEAKYFYGAGGASGTPVTVNGDVTNRFEFTAPASGNNINTVVGGTRNGNIDGNINNYFVSGKFATLRTASNNNTDTVGDIYNEIGAIELTDAVYVAQCKEVGNITNKINGLKMTGASKDLYLGNIANNSEVTGNITNELKGEVIVSRHVYCAGGISGATNYVVKGNVTTTVDMTVPANGKNVTNQFYTGSRSGNVAGKIETNFKSGSLATVVCGSYESTTGNMASIVNTFGGATMTYLETCRGAKVGSLVNNFTASTLPNVSSKDASFYAAGIGATEIGSVTNNISGTATFAGNFYAGAKNNANVGTITNNISGGIFKGLAYLGSCAGANKSVTSTITGGNFQGHVYGAALKATVNGNVTTSISGSPDFASGKLFYGGGGDSSNAVTINGSISNTVALAEGVSISGGFRGGSRNGSCGDITNNLISGNFGGINATNQIGGAGAITNNLGAITSSGFQGANGTVTSISNTFDGAVFTDHVYAGVVKGTVTGNITNEIKGATVFPKNFFASGGTSDGPATVKGNVTTNFAPSVIEGTKNSGAAYYGGVRAGNVEGKITNNISGGVFNNLYGGSYVGITGTVADVETTVKNATITGTLRANSNAANVATGTLTLTVDLTAGDVALLGPAAAYDENEVSTFTIKGGEGKLILGEDSAVAADELSGNLNVLMTSEPVQNQVYLAIAGDVKANVSVSAAEGIASPVVVFDGAETKVMGAANNKFDTQLLIADKIYVRALFQKAVVEGIENFTYSFTVGGKNVTGGLSDMEPITIDNVQYYAVTLEGMGVSSFEDVIEFSGTDYVSVSFSVKSLAVTAESAWGAEGKTEWVEVAKAIQNLNAVYNNKAQNTCTPAPVEGEATVNGRYPLAGKVQAATLSVAPIMKGAVGLRFSFTLTEAPQNFAVEIGGVDVTQMSNVTIDENNKVTVEIYFNAQYGTEKVNFLFLDGQTAYFNINTSIAQIAAQSAANESNSEAARANATALLAFLQTVAAVNANN